MKTTLVIALAALTIAACARDLDSYGYVPPAKLNPGLDQCLTAQGETKRCDQAKLETTPGCSPASVIAALTTEQ